MDNFILKDVKKIDFFLNSTEAIRKVSVCEITEIDLYEKNSEPKYGSLMDTRMGPNNKNILCKTCKNDINSCPGHFGHIELAVPVYNVLFMKYTKKILSCCCSFCSYLLIDYNDKIFMNLLKSKKKSQRFILIQNYNKNIKYKICYNCNRIQPKYLKEGISIAQINTIEENDKNKELKTYISAEKVIKIFKNISNSDVELLGMSVKNSRPECLLFEVLPVPPPCIRPSVKYSTNLRSEDDLIYKYVDILKANHNLIEKIRKNNMSHFNDYVDYLQYHIGTLIDNNIKGIPPAQHRSGRQLKCLKDRIKGKEARIRGNLLGKRVDFSARTVVGPDPSISIHQLGIPYIICKKITIPEKVNQFNIEKLQKCVMNGPNKYPGANFLIKNKNNNLMTLDLRFVKETPFLKFGDIVERHLSEDDYILFNRQPSLHKMSMMGHKVKPIIGKSFRLNPAVCQPYNADFDGDEMNIFVPQSFQTMNELKHITCVPEQIISPQSNSPVIGCIMDAVVGSSKLTQPDLYINEDVIYKLVCKIPNFDGILPEPIIINNKKHWKGTDIMNLILPKTFNYYKKNDKANIDIVNGKIISGIFDKSIVGSSSGGLIHMITNDLDESYTTQFLNTLQKVINTWLKFEGFSVGFGDTIADKQTQKKIYEIISTSKYKVKNFINMVYEKNMKISEADFEQKIFNLLNEARDSSGSIVMKNIDELNNLFQMVNSKSKGNSINISQIMSCVGQQNVSFKGSHGRIPFTSNNRTLPYYYQHDHSPESKGFVEHSYIDGLDINEFFFHAQSGREGLIDTACKTAETGYIQRRLMKSLEDLNVKYDLTVRNEKNVIIQFVYGTDNFDPKKVEKQKFELILGSNKDFENKYKWKDVSHFGLKTQRALKREYNHLMTLRKYFRSKKYYDDDIVYQPINIYRIVKQSCKKFKIDKNNISDLNHLYVLNTIKDLIKNTIKINCDNDYPFNELNDYNLKLLRTLVESKLSTKIIILENKLSKEAFDWVIDIVKLNFYKALIQPGESVGSISAQSLGEPTTQLTLNTFHHAGVSAKSNVNQGVPRIRELISVTKNPSTPSLTIYLKKESNSNKDFAKKVLNEIEELKFLYFVENTEIYYDNDLSNTITGEQSFLNDYYDFHQDLEFNNMSPWVLKIKISDLFLLNKNSSMFELYSFLIRKYDNLHIIYSDDNSNSLFFHIRYIHDDLDKMIEDDLITNQDLKNLKNLEQELMNLAIKGINDITKITMREIKELKIKNNGSIDQSKKEIVLDTTGTNMDDILTLYEYLDLQKTFSNDIHEVNHILGIEAARGLLKDEINNVLKFSGIYINDKHLNLLVDLITIKGTLVSIDRHGVRISDSGPLAKCSFEESDEHFIKSSIFNLNDQMKSLTSNLIMGQVGKFGTGICEVEFDLEKFKKNILN